jgi:gamma-glutamylaminecyclotransferase
LQEPAVGKEVEGELFEVDMSILESLDRIESVGAPGNLRDLTAVKRVDDDRIVHAWVFFKTRALAVPIQRELGSYCSQ